MNLPQLDREIADQNEEEIHGHEVPPERGRLLSDYVLSILRSFVQAAVPDNVVSAFAQVGIHTKLVDRLNPDNQVAYIDPATARVVVDNYGVIALPAELRVEPSPTWQLKISELNSLCQSEMAQQLRLELAEIREALAPPPARRLFLNAPLTYRQAARAPRAARARTARPARPAAAPPLPAAPPAPPPDAPRSAFRRARRFPTHTHTQMAGMKSYWGAATPR